jgi:flagellar basal-body rod modification protein FlgD
MQSQNILNASTVNLSSPGNGSSLSPRDRTMGKEDFLKLLVTQLRSQDPLQPVSNEAFVAQLAQFSSLEQMQNMNLNLADSLQASYLLNAAINNSLVTTMIGSEVKASTDEFTMTRAGELDFGVDLDTAYRSISVKIYDEHDTLVRTINVDEPGVGAEKIHWDGKDENGETISSGAFRFEVIADADEGKAIPLKSYLTGMVTGVRYRNGSAIMLLGGVEVMPSDIFEVLKP